MALNNPERNNGTSMGQGLTHINEWILLEGGEVLPPLNRRRKSCCSHSHWSRGTKLSLMLLGRQGIDRVTVRLCHIHNIGSQSHMTPIQQQINSTQCVLWGIMSYHCMNFPTVSIPDESMKQMTCTRTSRKLKNVNMLVLTKNFEGYLDEFTKVLVLSFQSY